MMRLLLLLALLFSTASARADTALTLFKSMEGNVNFVGGQGTMRKHKNHANDPDKACELQNNNHDIKISLSGIPDGATVLSAQLYWAGSGNAPDYSVIMDDATVTAPAARQYTSTTIAGGLNYFSGAADVTAAVQSKRNGQYNFSGLSVNNGNPWCASSGVVGGFSLLVIYSDASEPLRALNLYEGFSPMRLNSLSLTLGGFQIPTPLGSATGRIGHISWEGDVDLSGGESLSFNDIQMTDGDNPSGNQFNSKSNIGSEEKSYGIDFDAYTVGSPVIQAGQTSATTLYQAGQDQVLLSAEIVAVPSVGKADLAITMTRNNALVLGQSATYTLSVQNLGPNVETGPIRVVNTLPSSLTFVSASGSGWACSYISPDVICDRAGSLAVGATASPITLTVTVNAAVSITNSATVDGAMFDHVSENSTAFDTSLATGPAVGNYVFTNAPCTAGTAIAAAGPCQLFSWTSYIAGAATGSPTPAGAIPFIYITAVNASGVPVVQSATTVTTLPFEFALRCLVPNSHANVQATFGVGAGVQLPLCKAGGAAPVAATNGDWSPSASLSFAANQPSTEALTFKYDDVGQVQLYLRQTSSMLASGSAFISRPKELRLSGSTGLITNAGLPHKDVPAFAKAGVDFGITFGAYTATGATARNFKESFSATISNPDGGVAGTLTMSIPMASAGLAASTLNWSEVGVVAVTPGLATGSIYTGSTGVEAQLGRFYPDHFDTEATGPMACATAMACASATTGVTTAAYSKQPFEVKLTARNASGGTTVNYAGVFAKSVNLGAVSEKGGSVSNPPAASPGTLTGNVVAATEFSAGEAKVAIPVYTLPNAFAGTTPHANNWVVPTSIHIRAIEGAGGDSVTSLRGAASAEGGVRIVQGRLLVANVHGSERLSLGVPLTAQYWSGTGWLASATDNSSEIDTRNEAATGKVVFSAAKGIVTIGDVSLTAATRIKRTVIAGSAKMQLNAPGKTGSVDGTVDNPAWLPSSVGRFNFGTYRSPLIYVREVF